MRDFSRPDVLGKAFIAGLIGTAACLPKLTQWTQRTDSLIVLAGVLGWCVFVMWAFVFAWGSRDGETCPFQRPEPARFWLWLTGAGIVAGVVLVHFVDEDYRRLLPGESPGTFQAWLAGLGFDLSLQQLFFCFGPLAFLDRLGAGRRLSLCLTVALGLTVLTMKIQRSPLEPTMLAIPVFVITRASLSAVTVLIYRRHGALAVWWFAFLLQLRHLPASLKGE